MDQCYLHVKTVFLGGGTQGPVSSPVSFPKRSNQAWRLVAPALPRVELIQKVSTKLRPSPNELLDQTAYEFQEILYMSPKQINTKSKKKTRPQSGTPGREAEGGCARRVPQSPHVPSVEQSREPPRVPNYARMSL